HRDIKPSNLWMTQRGDGTPLLKVLDFGISKLAAVDEASSSITATQAVFGSPAYMSPEQIRSSKRVDHRTDVWALGVVLHELLTAHLPFEGESVAAILAGISADPPITLCSVRPDLPVEIERAILRCLEKDPNRRASLAELAERLAPLASSNGKISADRIPRIGSALSLSAPPPPPSSAPNAPSTLAMSATEPNLTTAHADAPSKIAQSIPRRLTLAGVSLAVVAALTFAGVSFSKSRRSHTASDGATGTSAMAVSESATAPAIPVTLPANATPPSSVKPPAQVPPPAQSTPPTTVAGAEKAASSTAAPRKGASPKPSPRAAKSAAPPRPSDTAAPPVVLPVVPKPPETPSSNLSEDRR
ncbi:MAG: serine/threonine protein kinase, partial [Labilithrix sp.]|nr:serine/threonine protein kinase [Labilithrix sp.]